MSEKELFGFTPEEVELIRKTVGKEAINDDELKRFLYRASKMGLNPLDGTIHLLTRNRRNESGKWEKVNVIIVGIDGFRIAADRSGKLAGIKRDVIYNEKGQLVRAVAEVYRKDWDHPAREVIAYREYCQTKEGKPVGLWASMPETMLKKCAEAAALRMAFASELAGIYIPEELMQSEEDIPEEKNGKKNTRRKDEQSGKTESAPTGDNSATPGKTVDRQSGKTEPAPNTPKEAPNNQETSENKAPQDEITRFEGELIILEPPKTLEHPTFGQYQEILAFDPTAEKTYTLVGRSFTALKPRDIIKVQGEVKNDKMKPVMLEKLTTDKPREEEKAGEDADVTVTVTVTSSPQTGRKSFDGQLEDVVWARAERGDEKYILVARGSNKNVLAKVGVNDTITIKGEMVSETNGTFIYITEIEAEAAA
jgi:phage recombination protein Bet